MKKSALCIFFLLIVLSVPPLSNAVDMESSGYRILYGTVNSGGSTQSSSSYNLTTSLGQQAASEFQSTGYTIKAGFQYIESIIPFTFTISNTSINLGTITPNTDSTGSTTLTVDFGSESTYSVAVIQNTDLTSSNGNSIPGTSCNGGAQTCTKSSSKLWTSSSSYGMGYNIQGDDTPADFLSNSYYRPFPDQSQSDEPVEIMSGQHVGASRQATLTIKTNVSSIQEAGSYHNILTFIATPGF